MWAACSNGHVEIVELMINAGADANKTDRVCSTVVLYRAYAKRHRPMVARATEWQKRKSGVWPHP